MDAVTRLSVSYTHLDVYKRQVQALALLEGREYAIPDDVKRLAAPVFGHRVMVNTRTALAQRRSDLGDRIIEEILNQTDVPL